MNWSNVKLIVTREIRDQLRDRRTLFMIAVLPLLLYPLLGMSFFKLSQFMREQPMSAVVLGTEELAVLSDLPPLVEENQFSADLFEEPSLAKLVQLTMRPNVPEDAEAEDRAVVDRQVDRAREEVREGTYQLLLQFPPGFGQQLKQFRETLVAQATARDTDAGARVGDGWQAPEPIIYYSSASEKSQVASVRVQRVLDRWRSAIGAQNLEVSHVPPAAAMPFDLAREDVAYEGHRDAALWSKILPFVLLIWALTGAFYPAIDLCAGEKERGTLETLLSSPAARGEIVWGKLLTVMAFSMATAVLNLISMGVTGLIFMSQIKGLDGMSTAFNLNPPPLSAVAWLLIALVPVSALFSALCLALAAFARSTKEGQYYLMPMLLVTMPLMMMPMAPGVELSLGTSLIPVTGVMLLLRMMLEGGVMQALPYTVPVGATTLVCCLLAIRWAIDQFNTESVLFRESERLDLGLWMKRLVSDRGDTPSVAEAFSCVVLIFVIQFFMSLALGKMTLATARDVAQLVFISQVVIVAMPALLMTILLTSSPTKTLSLRKPLPLLSIPVTLLLAVVLHPVVVRLGVVVRSIYPTSPDMEAQFGQLFGNLAEPPSIWLMLMLIAVLPAICEELAFRGFILSGLRRIGHKWWAIVLSAVFFGMSHGILQQSVVATITGIVIAYVAVQTGSLIPCILYHMIHNGLMLLFADVTSGIEEYPMLRGLIERQQIDGQEVVLYSWPVVIGGAVIAGLIFVWFHRLDYQKTSEETLQDALEHQSAGSTV